MGKALVFDGVVVTSPLQTITITTPDSDAERIAGYFSDLGSAQLAALTALVKSLKTSGAWDKMKYLMLPILATSVDEASQNVLLTSNRTPTATNLSFTDGKLFASGSVDLTDKLAPGMSSYNPCSFGWYLDTDNCPFQEEKLGQSAIIFGVNRLSRGRANSTSTTEVWSVNVKTLQGTSADTPTVANLSKFSAFSLYEESGNVKADNIIGDNETATTSTVKENGTFGDDFTPAGLHLSSSSMTMNYGVTYNGGYKMLWASSILTTSQLESTHKAFKTFIDTLEELSE